MTAAVVDSLGGSDESSRVASSAQGSRGPIHEMFEDCERAFIREHYNKSLTLANQVLSDVGESAVDDVAGTHKQSLRTAPLASKSASTAKRDDEPVCSAVSRSLRFDFDFAEQRRQICVFFGLADTLQDHAAAIALQSWHEISKQAKRIQDGYVHLQPFFERYASSDAPMALDLFNVFVLFCHHQNHTKVAIRLCVRTLLELSEQQQRQQQHQPNHDPLVKEACDEVVFNLICVLLPSLESKSSSRVIEMLTGNDGSETDEQIASITSQLKIGRKSESSDQRANCNDTVRAIMESLACGGNEDSPWSTPLLDFLSSIQYDSVSFLLHRLNQLMAPSRKEREASMEQQRQAVVEKQPAPPTAVSKLMTYVAKRFQPNDVMRTVRESQWIRSLIASFLFAGLVSWKKRRRRKLLRGA